MSNETPDLFDRLREGDRDAWRGIMASLIGVAIERIESALQRGGPGQPRWLARACGDDRRQVEAALYLAMSTLGRHMGDVNDQVFNAMTFEALAGHLIRLAVNRCQRERNRQIRGAGEAARGQLLGVTPGSEPSPPDELILREISENLEAVVKEILGDPELKELHAAIIRAKLADPGRANREITQELKTSDATVSRVWNHFLDELRERLGRAD